MQMKTTRLMTDNSRFSLRLVNIALLLMVALALVGCVMLSPPEQGSASPSTASLAPAPNAPATKEASPEVVATEATASETLSTTSNLLLALHYAPVETDIFAFTDWTVLKAVAGMEGLTSANTLDERLEFLRPLGIRQQAFASAFGLNYFLVHAETWGWDLTDLLWEATLTLDGPPLFILRFRDDFDFEPALALLEDRGYVKSEHAGATLYNHQLDFAVDWFPSTEFAIFNIAYLADEKIFVLSGGADSVLATLDKLAAGETLALRPDAVSVAAELGQVGSAILAPLGCLTVDVLPNLLGSGATPEELFETLQQSEITGFYSVFGVGYRVDEVDGEELPLGIFVMHYLSTEQAEADLEPRRAVAESADSLASRVPYAELFRVVDLAVAPSQGELGELGAANMVLRLQAIERSPQIFFNMLYQRDLLFAVCGGR